MTHTEQIGQAPAPRPRRRRMRRWIAAGLAAVLLVIMAGAVGGTWYYDGVPMPEPLVMPPGHAVVALDRIPVQVRNAFVAAQDDGFYDEHGTLQASPITLQYVRIAIDGQHDGEPRWSERVAASKFEDRYAKEEILGFYLNSVSFGRKTSGVEQAARAYYKKSAKDLTLSEAVVLAAQLGQAPGAAGEAGPFDPQAHPQEARRRWEVILGAMVTRGWLSSKQQQTLTFPA